MKEYLESIDNESAQMIQKASTQPVSEAPSMNELNQAISLHKKAQGVAATLLEDAKTGNVLDCNAVKSMVAEMVDFCRKSPEAFVNITRFKDFDNYDAFHAVNVAVLAISIGRRLGYSGQEMNNLGFAGLTHDIGKMQVPEHILYKPGKLTPHEYEIMKMHAVLGYEYLLDNGTIGEDILLAVKYHHEKSDGSGYPEGLEEKAIPKFAKVISIADVYDAMTSERSYNKGVMPNEALKMMFGWSGKHFNDSLVKFFISIMGIYPVGTLVVLDSNELAVILEPNKNDPLRPKVIMISNQNMVPVQPVFFDLTEYNVATHTPYKSIVSAINPRDFEIDTNLIIEQYIKSKPARN